MKPFWPSNEPKARSKAGGSSSCLITRIRTWERFLNNTGTMQNGGPAQVHQLSLEAQTRPTVWDGYVGKTTQSFEFARTNKAAVITLEHRYYGESSPFQNVTTTNLQHLTLDNAIQDIVYFANNVVLPFDKKRTSSPDKAPWVLTGAVVEAISDFWQFFEPMEAGMPKNCSSDLKTATAHIDKVLASGDAKAGYDLKKRFGLEAIANNDFGWEDPFYDFCDYLENVFPEAKNNNKTHIQLPGPEGVRLNKALDSFTRWTKEKLIPNKCNGYPYWANQDNYSVECFDHNSPQNPMFHDTSVENWVNRQWEWIICNEPYECWQVSGPAGQDTGLVSRFLDVNYKRAMCKNFFPREGNNTFGLDAGRTVDMINKKTGRLGRWQDGARHVGGRRIRSMATSHCIGRQTAGLVARCSRRQKHQLGSFPRRRIAVTQ
ncbi:hypothetical protein E4U58_003850 [Claviceps cyperi]|nr:hypothetical protein E4U58_003850 [Claviceps cyperi]